MDITLSIRTQMLATLMAALETAPEQAAGSTVSGRLLSLSPDGQAVLMIRGQPLNINFSPQALAGASTSLVAGQMVNLLINEVSPDGQVKASLLPPSGVGSEALSQAGGGRGALATQSNGAALPAAIAAAATSRAALVQATVQSSAAQREMGPLLANLQALVTPGTTSQMPPQTLLLSTSVVQAAMQLLGLRYDPSGNGASPQAQTDALKQAVSTSGIMHEARLMSGTPVDLALAAGDLKSALMLLRTALADTRAASAPALSEMTENRAGQGIVSTPTLRPPPHRDAMPVGQIPAEPDVAAMGNTARSIAAALSQQADGAIERVRLLQLASMPPELRASGNDPAQPQRWLMELPMVVDGRSMVLPLRIEREPERRNQPRREGALWRVRFALDGEPLGPLHAIITWQMRQLGVHLWAEREKTRMVLRDTAHELHRSFENELFDAIEIDIHAGRPVEPKPARGVFMDKMS